MTVNFELWSSLVKQAAGVVKGDDLGEVLRFAVHSARQLTGAKYAALGVIDENNLLADFVHEGFDVETVRAIGPLPRGRGVLGTIVRERKTIRLSDISNHPDAVGFPAHHPAMTNFLGVPVRVEGEAFGNLYLTEKRGGFTEEDEELVEAVAVVAGAAVINARAAKRLRYLAVVEDRERIARDLHDAIIQDLFAVGLQLQGAGLRTDDGGLRANIDDAVARLDVAIGGLRRFIFGLRQVTAGSRFATRLDHAIEGVVAGHQITVSVEVRPPSLEPPEAFGDHLVQIVRELTSNAVRHGAPSRLDITLIGRDDELALAVADDGRGFLVAQASQGMGLDNLGRRISDLGGTLHIDSEPGAGTAVHVSIPCGL